MPLTYHQNDNLVLDEEHHGSASYPFMP